MAVTAVVGRDAELVSIEVFLDEAELRPSALVLAGEAGIGKTALWEVGVESARSRFGRVLTYRSVEAEALLSFAGLSDLVVPVFDEVAPALAPLRRQALEIALMLVKPADDAPDPLAIGLAFVDVIAVLAEQTPLVIALDDLQWLDRASATVLQIALRRLRTQRFGLLVTERAARDASFPLQLDRIFSGESPTRLLLEGLSLGALYRLLRERLDLELTRPELLQIEETSGGNPFFALELGRELLRANGRIKAGRSLRVPETLHELLGGRLARLPEEITDVLLLAAALSRPTVDLVAAAHGQAERVFAALTTASEDGVVVIDEARLRFSHPLLASICYERAPPWKRRVAHRALAEAVTDLEEGARHLALAADGPDAAVAAELDAAAEHAAARGATAAAAELSELAAELTPDRTTRRRCELKAATFNRLAGDIERAAASLERLLPDIPSGLERADVLFALALTGKADRMTLIRLCEEALVEATHDDARSARILMYASWLHQESRSNRTASRLALERAERTGDPALLAGAIAVVVGAELSAGEMALSLAERGAAIEERLDRPLEYYQSARLALARCLWRLGDLDRARSILEAMAASASERGDEDTLRFVLLRLGTVEWYAGRWQRARDHANAALELAEQAQDAHGCGRAQAIKALVEADLGLVEQARDSAQSARAIAETLADDTNMMDALAVLGRLELALGELETAATYLRELPGQWFSLGLNDPQDPVWADTIETLIGLDELEEARAHLEQYELYGQRLGSPWAKAGAARCRGLLAARERDSEGALEALDAALAELDGLPYPFERGRTLLCLGSVRRQAQQKRSARDALNQALAIFNELGARLWSERARVELRRISGRRPPSETLTESERRVAELAGDGRTNKEIAAALFMAVSTVEAHLSRIYRKLGVRRAELAAVITPLREAANLVDEADQA